MDKQEKLVKYLIENHLDREGVLSISHLDFSKFNGIIYAHNWIVKGDLYQGDNTVSGSLSQANNEVAGDLNQGDQKVSGNLWQSNSHYGKEIQQDNNEKLCLVNGKDIKDCSNVELMQFIRKLTGQDND